MLLKSFVGALAVHAVNAYQTRFFPESGGLQESTFVEPLGLNYNLSDSQVLPTGSWWSSHFLHGSDNHEYLILSHFISIGTQEFYRASVLDISSKAYSQFTTFNNGTTNLKNGSFAYQASDYFMGSATADPLGPINTWSTVEGVSFNLTYELTSTPLLNGGAGVLFWEDALLTNEWSVPACATTGTLNVNGTTVDVVPDSSLSWYDRQWQSGSATNWTWFQLHVDSAPGYTGEKISNWFFPSGYGTEKGFATVRPKPGVNQVLATTLVIGERSWTSPNTNVTYPQEWTINYVDGTVLNISSILDDQELTNVPSYPTYEGFVNVVGQRANGEVIKGYGLVEMVPVVE